MSSLAMGKTSDRVKDLPTKLPVGHLPIRTKAKAKAKVKANARYGFFDAP